MLPRLDPRTLMVTGELTIAPVNSGAEQSHIAYAGGSIWVDGSDELVRVSPAPTPPTSAEAPTAAR